MPLFQILLKLIPCVCMCFSIRSMANLYNTSINNYTSSSALPQESDEISLFLQQIILRSSSSSSSYMHQQSDHLQEPAVVPGPVQISVVDPPGCSFTVANVSSSSVGNLDNEPDEYEYESEEAFEALVEEAVPKATAARTSSKRSRAAEVHNLSEKRRRSRINEKMKALQNLIPNSNKTDKASMLDEAIEYLKQLQLQVQMLTMRNGLSLYPICLPGMVLPNQMDMYDTDKFSNMNISKSISVDQNDALLRLQENYVPSKTSFKVESLKHHHFGPLELPGSSSKEKVVLKEDCSLSGETQTSRSKGTSFEAGGDHLLSNFVNSHHS